MTSQESPDSPPTDPLRKWQIAVAVLALLSLTLFIINLVLRARADSALTQRNEAVAAADQAKADAGTLQRRNDELLTQLSTSNERLTELTSSLELTDRQLSAADADVAQQVAAQQRAAAAAQRAQSAVARANALEAQLRNAQTCSAAAILAFGQIHAGPDIDSGSDEASDTLQAALPACKAGLE